MPIYTPIDKTSTKQVYIKLLLKNSAFKMENYVFEVDKQKFQVCFEDSAFGQSGYYHWFITNCEPENLPIEIAKGISGSVLVIYTPSKTLFEKDYLPKFSPNVTLKYRSIASIDSDSLKRLINAEIIYLAMRVGLISGFHLMNKFTRHEVYKSVLAHAWVVFPFTFILGYLLTKAIADGLGYNLSFLCEVVHYEPNCKTNFLREIQFLILFYSVFSLKSYYDYILSIFANINNDIFQANHRSKYFHRCLQSLTPAIFFITAIIICKAIFVFIYDARINETNIFIHIGPLFDTWLPFLKDDWLVYYFAFLDFLLVATTMVFFRVHDNGEANRFQSLRQVDKIKDAKENFIGSLIVDIFVIIFTFVFLGRYITDTQSIFTFQLVILQGFYLLITLWGSVSSVKFK